MTLLSSYGDRLSRHLLSWGYALMETPMLEETDLYLRKSGSRVITRLYSLTDPGGRRLSLRPEFTASIIKTYIQRFQGAPLPLRWQYNGPVFRYGSPPGPFGQFHQTGAEVIGPTSRKSDAEVMAAACKGLEMFGLKDYLIVMGHAGLLAGLLEELHLSERSKTLILANLEAFKEGPESVARLRERLKDSVAVDEDVINKAAGIAGVNDEEALSIFRKLLEAGGQQTAGSRTAGEIISRFQEKLMAQSSEDLGLALSIVGELANIRDTKDAALDAARKVIASYRLSPRALDDLDEVIAIAETSYGVPGSSILVDLGLVRGLAYYTGLIFELYPDRSSASQPVGGGGRYDGLVRALGGEDVPALGFAYHMERLLDTLEGEGWAAKNSMVSEEEFVLVTPATEGEYGRAIKEAEKRRALGQNVRVEVMERGLEGSLQYAAACGVRTMVVVGRSGTIEEYVIARGEWSRATSSAAQ